MRMYVKAVIALCVFCAVALAQGQSDKPKAAVYIMGNPEGRDALRMAVNTYLTKSGMYQMIAVDALDVVAREHNRQHSGAVSDGDIASLGRDAGAQYVCVVERTGLDRISYVAVRMVSVQSKVAVLADMAELPYGERIIDVIERLIYSMLGIIPSVEVRQAESGRSLAPAEHLSAEPPPERSASYLYVNNVTEASVAFGASGGTQTLTVTTDGGDYEVVSLPPWCSASKAAGAFSLACGSNESLPDRRDRFSVESGGKNVKVTVFQSGGREPPPYPLSKPERKPRPRKRGDMHIGAGGFFDSDAGGGITWSESGQAVAMPYYGGGGYAYLDIVYAEAFFGFSGGRGTWKSANATDPGDLPEMSRSYWNFGAFMKFPQVDVGESVWLFPLYGIDYNIPVVDTASPLKLKFADGSEYLFDGKDGRPSGKDWRALWFKFGAGIDIGGEGSYWRIEGLYGIRLANKFEKDGVEREKSNGHNAKANLGRGLTVRLAIGFGK